METEKVIQDVLEDLLKRLEVKGSASVALDETGAFRAHIQSEETGLLVGFHGRTLDSLQILLNILASKRLGSWVRIFVNTGDYREKREEALMYMAMRAAERAIANKRAVELPSLTSAERRVVHMTLSGDDRVTTESLGEGKYRVLVVKAK